MQTFDFNPLLRDTPSEGRSAFNLFCDFFPFFPFDLLSNPGTQNGTNFLFENEQPLIDF